MASALSQTGRAGFSFTHKIIDAFFYISLGKVLYFAVAMMLVSDNI